MKLNKLAAIPAIALAAGLGLAGCSSHVVVKAAPTVTHTVTAPVPKPTPAKTTHSAKPKPVPATPAPPPTQAAALPTVSVSINPDTQPQVEPSQIDLSADGNGDLNGLTWSSWTAYSAEGSGSFNVNNCQPDCAQGTTVDVAVSVALSAPVNGSFTAMTLTDSSGNTNTYAASNGSLSVVSDALYIADEPPAASATTPTPLPSPGWAPCTTIAGMYPGGLPGHINPSDGFCVMDGGTEG